MFNGILKSDDVEVYETHGQTQALRVALTENCKTNIILGASNISAFFILPFSAYIGKVINFTNIFMQTPSGKPAPGINGATYIEHSNTTLFTLKQGTVSFMYVGQQLNGLTATDKSKSGWIILGGVQGDTAITGYAGSIAIGSGAYTTSTDGVSIGNGAAGNGIAVGKGSSSTTGATTLGLNASGGNGTYTTTIGGATTTIATLSGCFGYEAIARTTKIALKANSKFSAVDDAQAGKFILMRQTTDATPLVMSATNAAASTSNILILPNTSAYSFTGQVVARDASTGDCAMWTITALMKRGANASTTALVGTPTVTKVFNDAGAAAWTIALTADTTNGGGAITVTGETGKTIRWVSNIDSAEVI